MTPSRRMLRLAGTVDCASVNTTGDLLVGVPPGNRPYYDVIIWKVTTRRTTGAAAATFTPQIDNTDGATTATSMTLEFLGAATATAALYSATNIMGFARTDTNGKLYFKPTPDVLGDTFSYVIWLEIVS